MEHAVGVDGITCADHVGHFVERTAHIYGHAHIAQSFHPAHAVGDGIEEHTQGAEDDNGAHGHGCFVRFAAHHWFGAEHCSGSANCATRACHERGLTVQFKGLAQEDAEQDGAHHNNSIHDDSVHAYFSHLLEGEAETVEDYARTQHGLRAELDAWHPRLGQLIAQAVGIEHTQDDADNQRTKAERLDKLKACNIEG